MLRLFAALAVPDAIAQDLGLRQQGLTGARWRPAEALHITLRFFGEVREDIAADLDAELRGVGGQPMTLSLNGVGTFGEGRDAHAVWAAVQADATLERLAARCEGAARRAGLKAESRAYRPHVTLAYLRNADPTEVAHWIQANSLLRSTAFTVERFGLYSSRRTKAGSHYRLEQLYPLA